MLAADWQLSDDPAALLRFLGDRADDRRVRLFGVACCRQNAERFARAWEVDALALAEHVADGGECNWAAVEESLFVAWDEWHEGDAENSPVLGMLTELLQPACSAEGVVDRAWELARSAERDGAGFFGLELELLAEQADFVRDLFGCPFRPVSVSPAWRTPTAVAVARAIYDNRTFNDLPILADALEDAGCDGAELLAHCRAGGVHVRGCWAVDLVVGKR